jgi:hypothetical protein
VYEFHLARVDLGFDLEVRVRANQELIRRSENLRVVLVTHDCFLCGGFTPLQRNDQMLHFNSLS